ncbi:MAG: ABC transporter permease subunit [Paracoccaceae bacterium]|nr:ABC transporter permease subunit [Paracoccaceae bacterium]
MSVCAQEFSDYALRAIGIGERLLPKHDITLCDQFVLIGSGMMWNIYFAVLAVFFGFFLATAVALARASDRWFFRLPAKAFIFVIRGSPLFIQFFIAYEAFVLIPKMGIDINLGFTEITVETRWLTKAWLGALIVLFLNTSAYTAQIFHGALMSVPKGDLEAADAIGLSGFKKFRRIVFPAMLRLAWPSYTNEAIFLFHATTLVFFSSFPAWRQKGDALYYASYFADKTFDPFIPYPIIALYFVIFTLLLTLLFSFAGRRLNRHIRKDHQ